MLEPEPTEIDMQPERLAGMDWGNDALFYTHSWRDETSMYDEHPSVRWEGGGEYYSRKYKARIPLAFKDCDELIDHFIEWMCDNYPGEPGFWVG